MKSILVPVDLSAQSAQLLEHALRLAKAFSSSVYLLHVVLPNEDSSYKDKPALEQDFSAETVALNRLAQRLRDAGIETHAFLVEGITAAVILEEAEKFNAELIILGSHGGRGLAQGLLAGVSEEVINQQRSPVLLVPTGE